MAQLAPNDTGPVAPPAHAAEVFAEVEPELAALRVDALVEPNLSIPDAAVRVLALSPTLQSWLPAIEAWLPRQPTAAIARIDKYALAMWYAHVRSRSRADGDAKPLVEEATQLRRHLLACARLVQRRGASIDIPRLPRGRRTHVALAGDLVRLAESLGDHRAAFGASIPTHSDDLARAMEVGHRLLHAVADRGASSRSSRAQWLDATRRAFTLLHTAYEAARRALTYLRWAERDADEIAPSLFVQGRRLPRPRRDGR